MLGKNSITTPNEISENLNRQHKQRMLLYKIDIWHDKPLETQVKDNEDSNEGT